MSRRERALRRELRRTMRASMLTRPRPDKALRARAALRRWGPNAAGAYAAAAISEPHRVAIHDEHDTLTFAQLDARASALARALAAHGLSGQDTIAVICANHHWLIETEIAAARLGASTLRIDPQIGAAEVARALAQRKPRAIVCDPDTSELAEVAGEPALRLTAGAHRPSSHQHLDQLIAAAAGEPEPQWPRNPARTITLACAPPGGPPAQNDRPGTLLLPGVPRRGMPLRARQTTMICTPLSSMWGHLHLTLAMRLASTLVLRERFDALEVLDALERHQVNALALTPEMLATIMELPASTLGWYRTRALRVIAVNRPRLPSELAIPAIVRFGPILYNRSGPSTVMLAANTIHAPVA